MSIVQSHIERNSSTAPAIKPERTDLARPRVVVRPYRSDDESQVLDLFALCLPCWRRCPDRQALFLWKHFENPFGPSHVLVVENVEGKVLGTVALMPWRLTYRNEGLACVRTVDMVTHPAYQRMGVASSFWMAAFEHLKRAKVALAFHTPNRRSVSFSRKGGRPVWTLQPRFTILNPFRVLPAALRYSTGRTSERDPAGVFRTPALAVSELLERRSAVDELLAHDARRSAGQLRTDYSAVYLAWRYASHPSLRYYALSVESAAGLDGCAIFRVDFWKGLRRIVLQDVFLRRCEGAIAVALRRQLRRQLDADLVHYHGSRKCPSELLLAQPSFPTPKRMNFTVGVYRRELSDEAVQPMNWSLSLGDLQEI